MTKVRLKKRNVGIAIGCLIVFIVLVVGIFKWKQQLDYHKTYEYKLQNRGYSKEDTTYLISKLEEKELDSIINLEHDERIPKLMKETYYLKKNLDSYLTYHNDHPDTSLTNVIAIVNVGTNNKEYTNASKADTSKEELILVNKYHSLEKEFEPQDLSTIKNWYSYGTNLKLREEAYTKFIQMYNAAKEDGQDIIINVAYRSYDYQEDLYKRALNAYGQESADKNVAHPGFSEYQTGLAFDVTTYKATSATFETFEEYNWLINHAHQYGFILRYPKDKEEITGYNYSAQHYRYVGVKAATYIHEHDITFDEYYAYFVEGDQ